MARRKFYRIAGAITVGHLLSVGLGGAPGMALSNNDDSLSQGLPGRRISGGTRNSETVFAATSYL